MFSYLKTRKLELEADVTRLECALRSLEQRKAELANTVKEYEELAENARKGVITAKQEAIYKCAAMVDLRGMRAFSVERVYKNNEPATIIGYYTADNVIREWTLWCSPEQHNAIVNEFRMIVKAS